MTKNIGRFLQELRKSKGLTQKELAEQIGISDKTISKWENGNSVPDTSLLLPLCNVLEITVNEFLSCERILPENYSTKAEENIMALIEENNCTKKVNIVLSIIGGVVVCIALVFMTMSNTGLSFSINDFIDFPSLISIVLVEIGVVLISRARAKEKVLQLLSKTILSVGLLNSIISMIFAFMQTMHGDIHMMGVCLAIAVLPLLYSVIVKIAVEILLTIFKELD